MATEVTYHSDGLGRQARPAINVKLHARWDLPDDLSALPEDVAEALTERAYEDVAAQFWTDAADMARELGLGEIEQEGRSGGWLVIAKGDPDDLGDSYHETEDDCRAEYACDRPDHADDPNCIRHELAEHLALRAEDMAERDKWLAAYAKLREWCEAELRAAPDRIRERARSYAIDRVGASAARRMFGRAA